MKNLYAILFFAVILLNFSACTNDDDCINPAEDAMQSQEVAFPEDNGAIELTGTTIDKVKAIVMAAGPEFAKEFGKQLSISEDEYNEIAEFTNTLVSSCTSEKDIYNTIFNWIVNNIKYEYGDQDPYAVFTKRVAICNGYANLLNVMLHTQGIPCINVFGELYQPGTSYYIGGHAWNYVYHSGYWFVSDPTNNGNFLITQTNSYKHLVPTIIDAVIFEDDYCQYDFYESNLNVRSIKPGNPQVIIPFSVGGYMISSLNPEEVVPSEVTEIYIGKNISSLGVNNIGLSYLAPNLEILCVDPENSSLVSFSNVIYKKNGTEYTMCLVAPKATSIELLPIETFDKESKIKNLENLESIVFVPGTKDIGAWTVENCPKLHTAYVPNDTNVEDNAFTGVAANFKIVRGDYTNIPDIKY